MRGKEETLKKKVTSSIVNVEAVSILYYIESTFSPSSQEQEFFNFRKE
jgi:hypothetical protein